MESVPLASCLSIPPTTDPPHPVSLQTPPKEGKSKAAHANSPIKTSPLTPSSNSVNRVRRPLPTLLGRTSRRNSSLLNERLWIGRERLRVCLRYLSWCSLVRWGCLKVGRRRRMKRVGRGGRSLRKLLLWTATTTMTTTRRKRRRRGRSRIKERGRLLRTCSFFLSFTLLSLRPLAAVRRVARGGVQATSHLTPPLPAFCHVQG